VTLTADVRAFSGTRADGNRLRGTHYAGHDLPVRARWNRFPTGLARTRRGDTVGRCGARCRTINGVTAAALCSWEFKESQAGCFVRKPPRPESALMGIKCIACNRRYKSNRIRGRGFHRCGVCWTDLRDRQEQQAAQERLDQAMRAWLAGAPLDRVRTQAGQLHPTDPAYRTDQISVITMDDAVGDLAGAVNQSPSSNSCPDRLATGVWTGLRRDFEFVNLRFVNMEPRLPKGYADVLIRERTYYPAPDSKAEMKFYAGSVFLSPSGDVVVRWHRLNYWPPGWANHPAPLGSPPDDSW
jgi:hypothetical protein